jgi:NADH-quinone oxidoreductase subunit L
MKKEKIKLSVILGELLILISFILVIVFATIGQKLEFIIPLIVAFPLIGMLINGFFGKFIPNRWVHQVAIGAILASFTTAAVSVIKLASFSEERVIVHLFSWISVGRFNVDFSFMLDHLSSVIILVITGIGGLIHLYSVGYMHGD